MRINRWIESKLGTISALFFTAIKNLLMPAIQGCGAGTNFSRSAVDELRSGITTCEQAAAKLGDPFGVSTDVEGKRLATWCYAGYAGAKAVTIAFSAEGVMERVVTFCEIHPSWNENRPRSRFGRG